MRGRSSVGALAALALLSGCSIPGSSRPEPDDTAGDLYRVVWPAGLRPPGDPLTCPGGGQEVATSEALQEALSTAGPGDVIHLADGEYEGQFRITTAGSRGEPVWLCGSPDSVLHSGGAAEGTVLRVLEASNWNLVGFTVRSGKKGVMVQGSNELVLQDLTVHDIGDEAVHLKAASSGNVVRGLTIFDTGNRVPEFGEGVYVGSAESNWCVETQCLPDRSDRNIIMGNDISGTTSEAVDVKEGTSGGVVVDNVIDGGSLAGDANSWVDVKGSRWLVQGNRGHASPGAGFEVQSVVDGWGDGNVFDGNGGEVGGRYGIDVRGGEDNVVTCSNEFEDVEEQVTNVECTPT
ncbi:right-handed parallel beta-helix repeat-containing protein [Paenibacillus sp. TRM 82003]|uniref:right-handed parallel beta-helix repeat-containing protein n=1 Tax=Kineococcus sp. TRM81007 TaxID=2925831 RepID=UPI001F597B12|nr:right-handed parallel beta-helix repeat-containing protein [Kineococcus sp. TRM81007]MCI2237840.1 right-handed parallel beta-helix repeat-containing protein [Kineococcus sp. TRM81007]MCI3919910.1 right-handed parallel beta-helix repeat-containing protein [Paenibacillus sp. TRM 82003]